MTKLTNAVTQHYAAQGLAERIIAALLDSGIDVHRLTPDDLAPLDQFHVRGKVATAELAQAVALNSNQKIVDVGGGIGGPARSLASQFGCDVTVVDLTEEYCRAGEILTEKLGLQKLVHFTHASALDMPFDPGSFDIAWEQHSSMNIEDKRGLYKEIARVLRPGDVSLSTKSCRANHPMFSIRCRGRATSPLAILSRRRICVQHWPRRVSVRSHGSI